jgi:hypothetical protein
MEKTVTRIAVTFLLSTLLAIGSVARPDDSRPDSPREDQKDKKKESIPEKQKGGGDRGGKGDDKGKKDEKKGGRKP